MLRSTEAIAVQFTDNLATSQLARRMEDGQLEARMEGRNSSETLLVFAGTLKHVVVCGAGYVCMHRTPNCTYTTIMQSHSHWQAHPFPLACAHMHAGTPTLIQ